jgi:S-adenosyl methyltransferase
VTAEDRRAPAGIDTTVPSVARVYDYFLGGKDNFAADRRVVEEVARVMPPGWNSSEGAQDNRAFLRRLVRSMVTELGIRQFIDIGSGLPSQGNVHEVAQELDPRTQVVYVDNDPIVLVHARALLGQDPNTGVITADLRDPEAILRDEIIHKMIDFSQPVGLLLLAILHHLADDEDPWDIAARLREPLPSGSYLGLSHFRDPGPEHPAASKRAADSQVLFNRHLGTGRWRTQEEILAFFGDFELLEPGLVPLPEWHPEPGYVRNEHPTYQLFVGGIARKP